jgi:hypothetical protein
MNNTIISGATNATYTVNQNGVYHVMATDTSGCEKKSNSISINTLDIANHSAGTHVYLYPNPNEGLFTLKGNLGTADNSIVMEITDLTGKVVAKDEVMLVKGVISKTLNLSHIPGGFYILKLVSDEGTAIRTFIKQ